MQPTIGGQHLLAELCGASPSKLGDAAGLMHCLQQALRGEGFHVLESALRQFEGEGSGCTAFVLLTESHAAVHTYPEALYAAVDVFSCGNRDAEAVVAALVEFLEATEVSVRNYARHPARHYQHAS